jgi:ribosomal protein S28E/S33
MQMALERWLFIDRNPMGPYEVGDILEAGSVIKGNGL